MTPAERINDQIEMANFILLLQHFKTVDPEITKYISWFMEGLKLGVEARQIRKEV